MSKNFDGDFYRVKIWKTPETGKEKEKWGDGEMNFLPRIGECLVFEDGSSGVIQAICTFPEADRNERMPVHIYFGGDIPACYIPFDKNPCLACPWRTACNDGDTAVADGYAHVFILSDIPGRPASYAGYMFFPYGNRCPHVGEYVAFSGGERMGKVVHMVYKLDCCPAGAMPMQIYLKEEKPDYFEDFSAKESEEAQRIQTPSPEERSLWPRKVSIVSEQGLTGEYLDDKEAVTLYVRNPFDKDIARLRCRIDFMEFACDEKFDSIHGIEVTLQDIPAFSQKAFTIKDIAQALPEEETWDNGDSWNCYYIRYTVTESRFADGTFWTPDMQAPFEKLTPKALMQAEEGVLWNGPVNILPVQFDQWSLAADQRKAALENGFVMLPVRINNPLPRSIYKVKYTAYYYTTDGEPLFTETGTLDDIPENGFVSEQIFYTDVTGKLNAALKYGKTIGAWFTVDDIRLTPTQSNKVKDKILDGLGKIFG